MSTVATDDKDGHGLKLENVGPKFSCFKAMPAETTKQLPYLFESAPNLELAPTSNKRPS